jgi:acyl-coenzyme A thioesterase PaaI-like protein
VVSVVDGETNAAPDGLQQLQAMPGGGFKAPIGQTLGFDLVEVERGRVVFEGKPDRSVYNPFGAVHGGYAATLLDSACGIATHSTPGPGRGPETSRRAATSAALGVDA